MSSSSYDVLVIGAGMSGLAAAIRLAMYDKKVCLIEKHSISGGLNSYYSRGKRRFDVGLHALTNYIEKGERRKPMSKVMKQLRLPYEDFKLSPQKQSKILFPQHDLSFTNEIEHLTQEVAESFPDQIDGFIQLIEKIKIFDEVNLDNEYVSAKEVVKNYLSDETLREMIFCPLLIYGSAWEHDMDFSQFVIMFKSIFLEGLSRPEGGVRTILSLLETRYKELGGEIRYKAAVDKLLCSNQKIQGIRLKNGEEIIASTVLSSMGLPETLERVEGHEIENMPRAGKMSFTESIFHFSFKPKEIGLEDTLIFYNDRPTYHYACPQGLYDSESAVLCFPNNFQKDDQVEGVIRTTFMAHYDKWKEMDKAEYKKEKEKMAQTSLRLIEKLSKKSISDPVFKDVFTPTTVERYTWHKRGAVYGSPDKSRKGLTPIQGLYVIGTDQGFLGIMGAMLSGISMANLYGLMKESH
jgi:phytoene dehydrogenase-like protein